MFVGSEDVLDNPTFNSNMAKKMVQPSDFPLLMNNFNISFKDTCNEKL